MMAVFLIQSVASTWIWTAVICDMRRLLQIFAYTFIPSSGRNIGQ
jgi:hypothetical protein